MKTLFSDIELLKFEEKLPMITSLFMLDKSVEDIKEKFSGLLEDSFKCDLIYEK